MKRNERGEIPKNKRKLLLSEEKSLPSESSPAVMENIRTFVMKAVHTISDQEMY